MNRPLTNLFLFTVAAVSLTFCRAGFGSEDLVNQKIYQTYLRIRDGVPPDPASAPEKLNAYILSVQDFTAKQGEWLKDSSRDCRNFGEVFTDIHQQLVHLMSRLRESRSIEPTSSLNLMPFARMQILISLSEILTRQVALGREGGMSFLDPKAQGRGCQVANPSVWTNTVINLNQSAGAAGVALMGVPGLNEMQRIEDGLAKAIGRVEESDEYIFWGTMVGGTVVSIALWQTTPAMIASLWGVHLTPGIATFAARTAAIGVEMYAFNKLQDELLKEQTVMRDQRAIISWSDVLDATRSILSLPLNSPRLYAETLGQLYNSMGAKMLAVLEPWEDRLLQAEVKYKSIDKANKEIEHVLP